MVHLSDQTLGYLSVAGAIIFFGSFAVPLKTRRVQEANVDPLIFQFYYSVSIFASSWLVLIFKPFQFTYFGIIGASLWVPASILSIAAINFLGLSIAVGVWAGVTIVTSFLWGALVFSKDQPVGNVPLSIVGVVVLVIGILCLSMSNSSFVKNIGRSKQRRVNINNDQVEPAATSPLLKQPVESDEIDEADPEAQKNSYTRKLAGFACAITLGVMNGSMMVPMRQAPKEISGINYLISFAIGVMIVTPVCTVLYFLVRRRMPDMHQARVALIPGLITGLLWNVGNVFSIYATVYLGMTVGFPLTQLALVVSGLYGIILFKELKGVRVLTAWSISLFILLGGAALLAIFGSKHDKKH